MKMRAKSPAKDWYEIRAKADESAEILIYDQIGEDWFGEGVSAKKFLDELKALDAKEINLRINSPGGSVFDGVAIFNALVRHKAKITVHVDGLAASIASVIALAGDSLRMAENSLFMVHNPHAVVMGEASDMLKMADTLNKIRGTMLDTYMHHANVSRREMAAMMDQETWLDASEAKEIGFVNEITPALRMAACFDLSGYKKVPDQLLNNRQNLAAVKSRVAHLSTIAARVRQERSKV